MHYLTISFTHKNTDLAIREKLAFNDDQKLKQFYEQIIGGSVNESIILSTCNRVEIITSVKDCTQSIDKIFNALSEFTQVSKEELEGRADVFEDSGAVHHLFAVISSLDSLVLGETQIVGQIKGAFTFSYENGYSGQKLARVMHHAFRCAAEVRSSTDISKNPVSVSSVAVSKAKEIYDGNLGGFSALIVGAGEMAELACKHLANAGVNLIIFNRDLERAEELAKSIENVSVQIEPFTNLSKFINRYRLLFSATGASHTVVTQNMVEETTFDRQWFDIAVPRDIEDFAYEKINIFAVDDLEDIVNKNLSIREENAKIAYSIVGKYTMEFFKWLQTLSVDPMIKEIRQKAKECSQCEIERALKKGYIPNEYKKQIEKILHQAFNSFLHSPTHKLKKISEQPQTDTIVQSIQYFFDLHSDQEKTLDKYKCEYQIEKDLKEKD